MTNSLPVYDNDPATFCIGTNASQAFNHGSNAAIYGQNSPECQIYMSQRCAKNWDRVCEYAASHRANEEYATRADTMGQGMKSVIDLSPSDVLLRNTAMEKYRIRMHGGRNCELKTTQFDPINPSSPFMSYYVGSGCVPEFAVDPDKIDDDPVMNRILSNPKIAMQMLVNIKNTMTRHGTIHLLAGTRLGNFLNVLPTSDKRLAPPYNSASEIPVARCFFQNPVQLDGLGLPGSDDYSAGFGSIDYWPTNYRAGLPYTFPG
jgi:hypothetical protein